MEKISFDCSGSGFNDEAWEKTLAGIDLGLREADLPSIFADEWDDTEDGCTFIGTEEQIGQIKRILSRFGVAVNEIRAD